MMQIEKIRFPQKKSESSAKKKKKSTSIFKFDVTMLQTKTKQNKKTLQKLYYYGWQAKQFIHGNESLSTAVNFHKYVVKDDAC